MAGNPYNKNKQTNKAPQEKLICEKCGVEMELIEASFDYLTRNFRHKVPRCPVCGQVCLPEKLVNGKMADVEALKKINNKDTIAGFIAFGRSSYFPQFCSLFFAI